MDLKTKGLSGVRCRYCEWITNDRSPTTLKFHLKRKHDTGLGGIWNIVEERIGINQPQGRSRLVVNNRNVCVVLKIFDRDLLNEIHLYICTRKPWLVNWRWYTENTLEIKGLDRISFHKFQFTLILYILFTMMFYLFLSRVKRRPSWSLWIVKWDQNRIENNSVILVSIHLVCRSKLQGRASCVVRYFKHVRVNLMKDFQFLIHYLSGWHK